MDEMVEAAEAAAEVEVEVEAAGADGGGGTYGQRHTYENVSTPIGFHTRGEDAKYPSKHMGLHASGSRSITARNCSYSAWYCDRATGEVEAAADAEEGGAEGDDRELKER